MDTTKTAYEEVYVYAMGRPGFILQHVADAFTVQTAIEDSKPIGVVFALVGLYLYVERGFSGRQVQKAHMELGRRNRDWPTAFLPLDRGGLTIANVLEASPGSERDGAIEAWCRYVWSAFDANREMVIDLLREYGFDWPT